MELKQIKDLMSSMEKAGIKRLRLKKEDYELELERNGVAEAAPLSLPSAPPSGNHQRGHDIPPSFHPPHETEPKPPVADGMYVTSPMVGTYYANPSPEDPVFVKVGDRIEADTVVCIIEAMKVMNEVKAGISGIVAEVLVESGHPVEFGSKLFRIK